MDVDDPLHYLLAKVHCAYFTSIVIFAVLAWLACHTEIVGTNPSKVSNNFYFFYFFEKNYSNAPNIFLIIYILDFRKNMEL